MILKSLSKKQFKVSFIACATFIGQAWACYATSDNLQESHKKPSPLHIRHPYNVVSDKIYAKRTRYVVALLELVMSKSGIPYSLEAVPLETVTANRNTRNLLSGHYDINWIHTNAQREKDMWPIRIPIFRGLIGCRLLLIKKGQQEKFSTIHDLKTLKTLTAGQGHDWPDTQVLQMHGFNLITSTSRDSLINMLNGNRIDYFPRSVVEIWDEMEVHNKDGLDIEKTIAIAYPSAYYFFVAKNNSQLANAIETGFTKAINDGSFNRLFMKYNGEAIERSKLKERRIFHIKNPTLTAETPLDNKQLWHKITGVKH